MILFAGKIHADNCFLDDIPCMKKSLKNVKIQLLTAHTTLNSIKFFANYITEEDNNNFKSKCNTAKVLRRLREDLSWGLRFAQEATERKKLKDDIKNIRKLVSNNIGLVLDGPYSSGSGNLDDNNNPFSDYTLDMLCNDTIFNHFRHLDYSAELDRRAKKIIKVFETMD